LLLLLVFIRFVVCGHRWNALAMLLLLIFQMRVVIFLLLMMAVMSWL